MDRSSEVNAYGFSVATSQELSGERCSSWLSLARISVVNTNLFSVASSLVVNNNWFSLARSSVVNPTGLVWPEALAGIIC